MLPNASLIVYALLAVSESIAKHMIFTIFQMLFMESKTLQMLNYYFQYCKLN
ncbi:hypothetical protein RchiOBHm_Chr2g0145571 [Rosa chinensis]|uniref:Uncharacterized protein n=1 Tax=Rosa chinensis TaxID=74649 RepID=A0A2P6RYP7_ROSCH|nr:hypothetical protein RchiOBHm_Chr2g0145571 [Rosa chinensis]